MSSQLQQQRRPVISRKSTSTTACASVTLTGTYNTAAPTTRTSSNVVMNGDSKVCVGSSDYLVLNTNGRHGSKTNKNISIDDTNTNYNYFESRITNNNRTTSETTTPKQGISRLTKKLSKHKKSSNDFPADEITEGASTIDVSVPDRISHETDDSCYDDSIIRTSVTTATTSYRESLTYGKSCYHSDNADIEKKETSDGGGIGRIYEEMRNDDIDPNIEENILLHDVSASRTSVSSSSDSSSDGNHQVHSNRAVVAPTTND